MRTRQRSLLISVATLVAMHVLPAAAQDYPSRPIRFIAAFPAGGSSDLVARVVSQRMAEQFGQPVVVDNRPGAGGSTGTELAAKSPPDGYTLLLGSVASMAINPHLAQRVAYDPGRDFDPVAALARAPQMLVVHPSLPAKTVQEFLELARKKPNALACGSGGIGTPAHFGCELLRLRANAHLLHVPYKGTGQSVNDLLGAQIHSVFASMPVGYPHVRAGRLRALATTSVERTTLAPELPTMIEAGVPGYVSDSWWGAFSPRGTPPAVLKKLGDAMTAIAREPQSRERFAGLGVEPMNMTPAELGAFVRSENQTYARIVKEAGITGQ